MEVTDRFEWRQEDGSYYVLYDHGEPVKLSFNYGSPVSQFGEQNVDKVLRNMIRQELYRHHKYYTEEEKTEILQKLEEVLDLGEN